MTAEGELDAELDAELADDDEHQGDDGRISTDPDTAAAAEVATEPDPAGSDADVFPRDYVVKLRQENADHRTKAAAAAEYAESLAEQLWVERVAALNLLADPTDLPYDADKLASSADIRAAAEELLARKPHLRTRRITARAGQGEQSLGESVSLSGMLRAHA